MQKLKTNIFLNICAAILLFFCIPVTVSAADVDTSVLGEYLGYAECYYMSGDTEYHVKYDYYAGADINGTFYTDNSEIYWVQIDNSGYDGWSNLGNPQAWGFYCRTFDERTYITCVQTKTWTDSAGKLQTTQSSSICNVQQSFTTPSGYLDEYAKDAASMQYLQQFLINGETYEDFKEYFAGDTRNYGALNMNHNTINGYGYTYSFNIPCMNIKAGLIPNNSTISENSVGEIWSNCDNTMSSTGGNLYCLPFLYNYFEDEEPPFLEYSKNDTDVNSDFLCYIKPRIEFGFFSKYYEDITWESDKFPQYSGGSIEIRIINTAYYGSDDYEYFYYSSNEHEIDSDYSLVSFDSGKTTICLEDAEDFYTPKILNDIIATPAFYKLEVRAVSADNSIKSNWVVFTLDSKGNVQKILDDDGVRIEDDEGNVIDSVITDNVNYNKDMDDKSFGIYDSNGNTDTDYGGVGDLKKFVTWLEDSMNAIGQLPQLLSITYAWLPADIIYALGVSLVVLIIIRILGR